MRAHTDLVDLLYKHLLERKKKVRLTVLFLCKITTKHTEISNKKSWFQRVNIIFVRQEHSKVGDTLDVKREEN